MNDTKLKDLIGRCQKRFSKLSKNFQNLEKNLEFLSVMSSDTYDLLKAGFDGDDVVDLRELADTLLHSANALADTASVAEWFNDRVEEVSKKVKASENVRSLEKGKKLVMKESDSDEKGAEIPRFCVIRKNKSGKSYDFEHWCDSGLEARKDAADYANSDFRSGHAHEEYWAFDTKKWKASLPTNFMKQDQTFDAALPIYYTDDDGKAILLKDYVRQKSEIIEVTESFANTLNIDMWYEDSFNKEDYAVTCTFYPNDGEYRGNIYRLSDGKIVGDYSCSDSTVIEDRLGYDFD